MKAIISIFSSLTIVVTLCIGASGGSLRRESPVRLDGYLQASYALSLTDEPAGSFGLDRARLILDGGSSGYAGYKLQFDVSEQDIQLLDAVGRLNIFRRTEIMVGRFKVAFSRDRLLPSSELKLIRRSLVADLLSPGSEGRSTGLQATIEIVPNHLGITGGVFNRNGRAPDRDLKKDVLIGTRFSPMGEDGLDLRFSYYRSPAEDFSLMSGSFHMERKEKTNLATVTGEIIFGDFGNIEKAGFYILGSYKVDTSNPVLSNFEIAARYDSFNPDLSLEGNRHSRLSLGANLYIGESNNKIAMTYYLNGGQRAEDVADEVIAQVQVEF